MCTYYIVYSVQTKIVKYDFSLIFLEGQCLMVCSSYSIQHAKQNSTNLRKLKSACENCWLEIMSHLTSILIKYAFTQWYRWHQWEHACKDACYVGLRRDGGINEEKVEATIHEDILNKVCHSKGRQRWSWRETLLNYQVK